MAELYTGSDAHGWHVAVTCDRGTFTDNRKVLQELVKLAERVYEQLNPEVKLPYLFDSFNCGSSRNNSRSYVPGEPVLWYAVQGKDARGFTEDDFMRRRAYRRACTEVMTRWLYGSSDVKV